ncbi:MAG: NAD(P)-dependent oxidoreductase [Pseudomonadales bacterium]|mgnify:FL=1|jgi:nucleoside-diphosphate-sugar epimerase|nr:NAD(P)-dependent oxidoreductase [Pseudomonadales bacterium]
MTASRTILVTGAFGNLGQMVLAELKQRGHRVLAMDLDNPGNRQLANTLKPLYDELAWGDLRTVDFKPLLQGCIAVIHLAAVLPPVTERAPELAYDINVKATLRLIADIEERINKPLLVYPSSVTVFGMPEPSTRLMQAGDAVAPSDNYTRHKVEVEQQLAASNIPWSVLRVGVSVDSRTLGADLQMIRKLFQVAPDNPLEYVHPCDVATAMANAINNPRAVGKVLLLGGGGDCRVTQHQFLSAAINALGIELPRDMLGHERYYTSWMDTAEAQDILQFQHHRFADYQQDMRQRLRWVRLLTAPLAPLVLWIMRRLLK